MTTNTKGMNEAQIEDLYVQVRDRMNTQAFGYCPTESGTEFILLKRFFSPEDAYNWLKMPQDVFFTADTYSELADISIEEAKEILEDQAHRGLLYRVRRGGRAEFRIMPVAHGVYEFNLDKVEPSWGMGLGMHLQQGEGKQMFEANYPFYRSVPVKTNLVDGGEVLPYDDIVERLDQYNVFALSPCVCRELNEALGAPSDYPMETCVSCGEMAEFYLENNIGREISKQEVIDILAKSVELGMVIQTCCSKASEIICSCHSTACGILSSLKAFPGIALKNVSRYRIETKEELCGGCAKCAERCPMGTIEMVDDKPVTGNCCVSCGQCAYICPTNARVLVKKDSEDYDQLPDTIFDTYLAMQDYRRTSGDLANK